MSIDDDMAFIDRLHFYLPSWEVPKMHPEHFTDHYGFVVDYLAEALRELRKHNFTEVVDRHFSLGAHLNARDRKAVRRTVSGLMKILHPHGEVSRDDLEELLSFALEGRRRVKEQLKKMGSFEYYQTFQPFHSPITTWKPLGSRGQRPPRTLLAVNFRGHGYYTRIVFRCPPRSWIAHSDSFPLPSEVMGSTCKGDLKSSGGQGACEPQGLVDRAG